MKSKSSGPTVWPQPRSMSVSGSPLVITRQLAVIACGESPWLAAEAGKLADLLNCAAGKVVARPAASAKAGQAAVTVCDLESTCTASRGIKSVKNAEGYSLKITPKSIVLVAADAAGAYWGAQTLAQLVQVEGSKVTLPAATIRDWPEMPIRGAHVYVPPAQELGFFERFLDMMASLKFNTLFIEVGGGMEFKKHPEINHAWAKFSHDALTYDWYKTPEKYPSSRKSDQHYGRPGAKWGATGPVALQVSRYFWKDSTHPELAGGQWLTQVQVKKLLAMCRDRHIEVIPEVQSLSHSYWLCCGHPEIAERQDDPWPDTYCPSNPRTYELLFDCMQEVIDVFKPRIMHIGHDELLSVKVCPRCKKKSAAELYAGDVTKIHDFLAARGVRTLMWPDKLIRYGNFSGVGRREQDPGSKKWWILPPTWQAIDMIPRDIILLDWYWEVAPHAQKEFAKRGFEMVYGNWGSGGCVNWRERSSRGKVLGAEVSSWCEMSAKEFGHNRIFYPFFPSAHSLWRGEDADLMAQAPLMAQRMTAAIDRTAALDRGLVKADAKVQAVDLSAAAEGLAKDLAGKVACGAAARTVLGAGPFELLTHAGKKETLDRAVIVDAATPKSRPIAIGRKAARLALLHATTMQIALPPTYHHYDLPPGEIVQYEVKYADGKRATFTAVYGLDIGPIAGSWPSGGPGYCWRSVPVALGDAHTLYAQEWVNPRPKVAIESLTVKVGPRAAATGQVILAAVGTM